jgi:hypothetical protein
LPVPGIREDATGDNAVRNTVLALAIVALATPAIAQDAQQQMGGSGPNLWADGVKLKTDVEVKQEQDREAGFKAGLGKIPDAKAKKDPWGNVRSDAKSAQAQSKSK